MKSGLIATAILALCACVCVAGQPPTQATIVSMQSVECGQKHEGKKKSTALLCQQYVIHTATTEYRIRQQKPEEQEILPANTSIQFTLDKHKMKFKANGKKYEYLVVGMTALQKSHYEDEPDSLNAARRSRYWIRPGEAGWRCTSECTRCQSASVLSHQTRLPLARVFG